MGRDVMTFSAGGRVLSSRLTFAARGLKALNGGIGPFASWQLGRLLPSAYSWHRPLPMAVLISINGIRIVHSTLLLVAVAVRCLSYPTSRILPLITIA